jgi:hypothetical protein
MPKAPSKKISSAPFPFIRQFTAPPFSAGLEDAKFQSQLLLGAVQHTGTEGRKVAAKRPTGKKPKLKVTPVKKRRGAGNRAAPRK